MPTHLKNGLAVDGVETRHGVTRVRGTAAIDTGLASVSGVVVTLNTDPGTAAGAPAFVTATLGAAGAVTLKVWQDDLTAATAEATVAWTAHGTPKP